MTKHKRLPEHLNAAYDWTFAAGELDELRDLKGVALQKYCRQSAVNSRDNDSGDVTEDALFELHEWLGSTRDRR